MKVKKRITETPKTNFRVITTEREDGSYCVGVQQFVGSGWCYPWEVAKDGWRYTEYRFADTYKKAATIHNGYIKQLLKKAE